MKAFMHIDEVEDVSQDCSKGLGVVVEMSGLCLSQWEYAVMYICICLYAFINKIFKSGLICMPIEISRLLQAHNYK